MFTKINNQKNKSGFFNRFRQNIWENRKFFIIMCVISILCLSVFTVWIQAFCYTSKKHQESSFAYSVTDSLIYDNMESFMLLVCFFLAVIFLAGLPAALRSFSYLSKKNRTDMVLSFPVSTSSRFAADFLSGLFIYAVPFFIASVVSLLILLVGYIFTGNGINEISAQSLFDCLFDCNDSNASEYMLIEAGVFFAAVMIQFYTFSVFVAVCCGSKYSAYIYSAVLNISVPLLICVSSGAVYSSAGIINNYAEINSLLAVTSPAGGLLVLKQIITYGIYIDIPIFPWLIKMSAVIILLAGLSFMLYRRRKAEDTSKTVVFPVLFYILLSCATTVSVGLSFANEINGSRIAVLLITVLAIFAMSAFYIHRKNNKIMVMTGTVLCTALSAALSAAFFTEGQKTEGFGVKNMVPDVSSVKSVTFYDSAMLFENILMDGITLYDEDAVSAVCSIHNDIVKMNESDKSFYYSPEKSNGIRMLYTLKNGDIMERIYYLNNDDRIQYRMYETDEYRKTMADRMYRYIMNRHQKKRGCYFSVIDYLGTERVVYNCPDTPEIRNIVSEIAETLAEEIVECDEKWYEEDYYVSGGYTYGQDALFIFNEIYIPDAFEKTKSVIERNKNNIERYIVSR